MMGEARLGEEVWEEEAGNRSALGAWPRLGQGRNATSRPHSRISAPCQWALSAQGKGYLLIGLLRGGAFFLPPASPMYGHCGPMEKGAKRSRA